LTPDYFDLGGGAFVRRYEREDLATIWALVEPERDRLRRWLPWAEQVRTIDDEGEWLDQVLADPDRRDEGWAIFDGDAFAGGIGIIPDPLDGNVEIGYWLGSGFEGRGLVTRACRVLIEYAFGEIGAHRITIAAAVGNTRSRHVPERLGFTQEAILREATRTCEGFEDLVVYGLLRNEWTDA